jgi:hypothetical protein
MYWLKSQTVPVPVAVNGVLAGLVGVKLSETVVGTPLITVTKVKGVTAPAASGAGAGAATGPCTGGATGACVVVVVGVGCVVVVVAAGAGGAA